MKKTVALRVLGGSQCGSIGCVILAAAFYGVYWSHQTRFSEREHLFLMLFTTMYGAFYGVALGIGIAFHPKTLTSALGSLAMGTLGVFTVGPISEMLFGKNLTNAQCLPLLAVFTIIGAALGPLVIPEWWKKNTNTQTGV